MQVVFILCAAVVSPLLGLVLLLWLAHLEDTLPQDVQRAGRRPDPAPILAIPVRRAPTVPAVAPVAVLVPTQRTAPVAELVGGVLAQSEAMPQAFSRSTSDSLGGSTNR
jgi:hypothetical protein